MAVDSQPPSSSTPPPSEIIQSLLRRPADQRLREFKYRFAQSVVFGLPVVALQRYGRELGWVEADRWVGILQALLAGWVVYVGAAGMLLEGLLTIRRGVTVDAVVALTAVILYLFGVVSVAHLLLHGALWHRPMFDAVVVMLAMWCGLRWWQMARRASAAKV